MRLVAPKDSHLCHDLGCLPAGWITPSPTGYTRPLQSSDLATDEPYLYLAGRLLQ